MRSFFIYTAIVSSLVILVYFVLNNDLLKSQFYLHFIVRGTESLIILFLIWLSCVKESTLLNIVVVIVSLAGIYLNYLAITVFAGTPFFNFIWFYYEIFDKDLTPSIGWQFIYYIALIVYLSIRIFKRLRKKLPNCP